MSVKICSKCKKEFPATAEYFYRYKARKDGFDTYCKKCKNKQVEKYRIRVAGTLEKWAKTRQKTYSKNYAQGPKGRNTHLVRNYGITLEQYDKLFQEQQGVCAICNKIETAKNQYGLRRLSVDHCHNTSKIRGLLCFRCNVILGLLGEDIKILQKTITYLRS